MSFTTLYAIDIALRIIDHYFHLKGQPQKKHIIAREGALSRYVFDYLDYDS